MSHLGRTLFSKATLIASLSLAVEPISALQCQLNQYGMCDIPDSTLVQSSDGTTTQIQHEPISHYGNPSYYRVDGKKYHVLASAAHYDKVGVASWYGKQFQGKLTANREVFDMYKLSAASKTLPLPCFVKVTNLANGKSLIVRVNDRGPYVGDRLIDLSYAAAEELGFTDQGITKVRVTAIHSATIPEASHYLQVASFTNLNYAERFKEKLAADIDENVRIHQTHNAEHPVLYRIEVGPFENTDDLTEVQQAFKAKGYHHTIAILS